MLLFLTETRIIFPATKANAPKNTEAKVVSASCLKSQFYKTTLYMIHKQVFRTLSAQSYSVVNPVNSLKN